MIQSKSKLSGRVGGMSMKLKVKKMIMIYGVKYMYR